MNALPYIDALNHELGLDIVLPPSGSVALALEGRNLLLQWVEKTQSFVVYVEIGSLAGWRNGTVCRQLLAANFLFAETLGGALSYNEATSMVGLNFAIPVYGLDTEAFLGALNHCIVFSETWKTRLDAMNKEQERAVEEEQSFLDEETQGEELPFTQLLRV